MVLKSQGAAPALPRCMLAVLLTGGATSLEQSGDIRLWRQQMVVLRSAAAFGSRSHFVECLT